MKAIRRALQNNVVKAATGKITYKEFCRVSDALLEVATFITEFTPGEKDDGVVAEIQEWQQFFCPS